MVTFDDILDAFNEYRRRECKQTWDALWIKCDSCMSRLIKAALRGSKICDDELHDMIQGSVCSIMERFRVANYADIAWIESRFSLERASAFTLHQRRVKKESPLCEIEFAEEIAVNIIQKPCQSRDYF